MGFRFQSYPPTWFQHNSENQKVRSFARGHILILWCISKFSMHFSDAQNEVCSSPCFGLRVMALLLHKCFSVWHCRCEWQRKMRLAIVRLCQSSCEKIPPTFGNTIWVQTVTFRCVVSFRLGGTTATPQTNWREDETILSFDFCFGVLKSVAQTAALKCQKIRPKKGSLGWLKCSGFVWGHLHFFFIGGSGTCRVCSNSSSP